MKFVSYIHGRKEYLGFICGEQAFQLRSVNGKLPATMDAFLRDWEHYLPVAREAEQHIRSYPALQSTGFRLDRIQLLAPVPRPASIREGLSFPRQAGAPEKNPGLQCSAESDRHPVFAFGNHHAVFGPGPICCMPDHFENLDFELQVAIVICKKGRNIRASQGDAYIGGLMIMNGFSARTTQRQAMALHPRAAKGRDFATGLGPVLVTTDELLPFEIPCKENHIGKTWNLSLSCMLNDEVLSRSNLADMEWTFAEIIERASYGVDLFPGDIISSAVADGGCFMELNGRRIINSGYGDQWLTAGDKIVLRADGLGELENRLHQFSDPFSIPVCG